MVNINILPLYLILIPLTFAFLSLLFNKLSKALGVLAPVLNLLIIYKLSYIFFQSKASIIVNLGGWKPPFCINLVIAPLSLFLAFLISLIALASSIYSIGYIHDKLSYKYYSLFLLLITGATGSVLTGDIFNLFVFFEILCISSYILVAYEKNKDSYEAAIKYLVQGSLGSTLMLLGIAILYGLYGTLNMADLANHITGINSIYLKTALALLISGFGVEAAIFPLNTWLPDAHPAAPSSISAMLSGVAIKVGVYAIFRVVFTIFGHNTLFLPLLALGIFTLITGELSAYKQDNLKRLLAYSSTGQIGLIVIALSIGSNESITAGLYQILSHALAKSLLFLSAGYFLYKYKTLAISKLKGLGRSNILVFSSMIIAIFSLLGIPPMIGFYSKFSILMSLFSSPVPALYAIVISIILMTGVEAAYFLRLIGSMGTNDISYEQNISQKSTSDWLMIIPIITLAILIIIAGFYPHMIQTVLGNAADNLFYKNNYVFRVLGGY